MKNLSSVLAANDKNSNIYIGSLRLKSWENVILVSMHSRFGGLKSVISHIEVNEVDQDLLQLYHKKFGYLNKKHMKKVISENLNTEATVKSKICIRCISDRAFRISFGARRRTSLLGELIQRCLQSISSFRVWISLFCTF